MTAVVEVPVADDARDLTDAQREHLREWAAALRSGRYVQGGGSMLRDLDGRYSHDGVAADQLPGFAWEEYAPGHWCLRDGQGWASCSTMPREAYDWYGLQVDDWDRLTATQTLTHPRWPFTKVADALDQFATEGQWPLDMPEALLYYNVAFLSSPVVSK